MPVVEDVVLYVGDKILTQIIKEEVYSKRIRYFFCPPVTYKNRLTKIIYETIDEFEKSHPYDGSKGLYPFYHSQVFFSHLSLFVLYKKGSLGKIEWDIKKFPQLIPPKHKDIEDFYKLFTTKTNADEILNTKFIEENYQKQIFEVCKTIDEIKKVVDSVKDDTTAIRASAQTLSEEIKSKQLTPEITTKALESQVGRQLKKQISSGKYLKDTFIETGDHKDHLRFICDNLFYSGLFLEEISVFDFRHLNIILSKKGESSFTFNLEVFQKKVKTLEHNTANNFFLELFNYLETKCKEIVDLPLSSNDTSTFKYKFTTPLKIIKIFQSKVAIITEKAGQGKTNFLCDFVENFLLKRGIPVVFLTGTDIRPDDIRGSILFKLFPDRKDLSFDDLIQQLKKVCEKESKYFIVIIDGLNENANPSLFSRNLEAFITEMIEYNFIRVVLSCRTEYYERNFKILEKSNFKDDIFLLPTLLRQQQPQHRDKINEKLFYTYFSYFNVSYKTISNKVFSLLSSNFLLLRIFCETYQGQQFENIDNIYKEELFENYYTHKSREINNRFIGNDEYNIKGNFDIRNFIRDTIKWMVENEAYTNVPLDTILAKDENRSIYIRFLDENILVRRDILESSAGIFGDTELVNFTFDEFRDFLLTKYLIDEVYPKSESQFCSFLLNQLSKTSPILEGCSSFLFYISRNRDDSKLKEIISDQLWYPSVFADCIFNVKDDQVTKLDKAYLKNYFLNESENNHGIIFDLITRYDTESNKNLNLDFLLDILIDLDSEKYVKVFSRFFSTNEWAYQAINQNLLIGHIAKLFETKDLLQHPKYHKLFELLLYMFDFEENFEIQNLYEAYYYQNNEVACIQLRKALQSKNESLLAELNLFIESYEIHI